MPSQRATVTYVLGFVTGAVLFFLIFAAVFNGSWLLLLLVGLGYAGVGALGARVGGAARATLAVGTALPAVPWVLWLFPASVREAGLARALLWPGLLFAAGGLTWLGAWLADAGTARSRQRPGAA